jgi:hypothetical protein
MTDLNDKTLPPGTALAPADTNEAHEHLPPLSFGRAGYTKSHAAGSSSLLSRDPDRMDTGAPLNIDGAIWAAP